MPPVQLLYAKNSFRRRNGQLYQELTFCISVANLAFKKQVVVIWKEESGKRRLLEARYHCPSGEDREIWMAHTILEQGAQQTELPGTIKFSIRFSALGHEFWDDNCSRNYVAEAGCGVLLREGAPIQNLYLPSPELGARLSRFQDIFPVTVVVASEVNPQQVIVRWTTDGWRSCHSTLCRFKGRHGKKGQTGFFTGTLPGLEPGLGKLKGPGLWTCCLPVQDAFAMEYAIALLTPSGLIWDNNLGLNYGLKRHPLKVLTLNLHCYQEENQEGKFKLIAKAINELDIDLICLQEVGEHWRGGHGDWNTNAARIIADHLNRPYHLFTEGSHIGFERFREGSAILSRYPFLVTEAEYVSESSEMHNINARKVCLARVHVPSIGVINLFCVHVSWWDHGFREQFHALNAWVERMQKAGGTALLCGDFNVSPGSAGYQLATELFDDQILLARRGVPDQSLVVSSSTLGPIPSQEHSPADNERIDHILLRKGSRLKATAARALFTDADYGRVSDHCGYYVEFEPA